MQPACPRRSIPEARMCTVLGRSPAVVHPRADARHIQTMVDALLTFEPVCGPRPRRKAEEGPASAEFLLPPPCPKAAAAVPGARNAPRSGRRSTCGGAPRSTSEPGLLQGSGLPPPALAAPAGMAKWPK